jgi:PII-like signaling protein
MKQEMAAQELRVYVGEQDHYHGTPLYAVVVDRLKQAGIAGVTVLRGTEGYGAHKQLHTDRIEVLFAGLPVVIEAVDSAERIHSALTRLDEIIEEGLVTLQDVRAIRYKKNG